MALTLAFLGLGAMGRPMAERLVQSGHRLQVFDVAKEPVAVLSGMGATAFASPAAAVAGCDIAFACLPSAQVSIDVALGPAGAAAGRCPIYCEMSTIGSTAVEEIAAGLARKG